MSKATSFWMQSRGQNGKLGSNATAQWTVSSSQLMTSFEFDAGNSWRQE